MLVETAIYAASYWQTPRAFRPHLPDAIGLWARGRRQRRAWRPHLERTRAAIENALAGIPSRRTVAVLGAGPLFDVPLEALARNFGRVLLIDLAHLSTTALRVRRHHNVERVWRDLAPEDAPRPLAFLHEVDGLDWVISVNLLSQIGRAAPEGKQRAAIDAHLDGLCALAAPVTLVTDVAYRVFDRAGALLDEEDMMRGRPMPPPEAQWPWEVAPFGEESTRTRRVHTVFAYPDWHARRGLVLSEASSMVRRADPVAQQDRAWDS